LFDFDQNYFYWKVLFVLVVLIKATSMWQRSPLTLYYNKKNRLMSEFIEKTKVSQLEYRPYWLCVTPFLQTLVFILTEEATKFLRPEIFDRELLIVEDGGTLGIDWAWDKEDKGKKSARPSAKKPILLMAPGLGGANDNLYTTAMMREARK